MKKKITLSQWVSYIQKLVKPIFEKLKLAKDVIGIYQKVLKPITKLLLQIVPPVLIFLNKYISDLIL